MTRRRFTHPERFCTFLPWTWTLACDPTLFAVEGPQPGRIAGIGWTLETVPLTGCSEATEDFFASLLTGDMPSGTCLAFSLFASGRIEPFLTAYAESRTPPCASALPGRAATLRRLARRRAQYLARCSREEVLPGMNWRLRHFRSWMSCIIPVGGRITQDDCVRASDLKARQEAALRQQALFAKAWAAEDLLATAREMLNPGWEGPGCADSGLPLRDQCILPDPQITVTAGGIDLVRPGSAPVTVLGVSTQGWPDSMTLASLSGLIGSPLGAGSGIPCPFVQTAAIEIRSREKTRAADTLRAARAQQIAQTELARFIPGLAQEADDWQAAQQAWEGAGGTLRLAHQLVLFAPAAQSRHALECAHAAYHDCGLAAGADTLMHLQALLTVLPMSFDPALARDIAAARRMTTKTAVNAACALPILAESLGTGPRPGAADPLPVLLLAGRRGQVTPLDPFANPNGNYNGVVIGASGSGKSELLNDLTQGILGTGGRVWIIDAGRSYEKLCRILEGTFIDFAGEGVSLNPFAIAAGSGDALELLVPLVAQMASPAAPLSDVEHALLAGCVREEAQARGAAATIDSLCARLKAAQDARCAELALRLAPYCAGGDFGRWFGAGSSLTEDGSFTVLELGGLAGRPALQQTVVLLLMMLIDRQMREDPARAKLVILDEAWDLMRSGAAAEFIERGYRRARKANGGFFTATQSAADYWKSETARAALCRAADPGPLLAHCLLDAPRRAGPRRGAARPGPHDRRRDRCRGPPVLRRAMSARTGGKERMKSLQSFLEPIVFP